MDKTSRVINCGKLKDYRMLCGTITSDGELTNRIDGPQRIYAVNNNGKNYLFEQYNIPYNLEYIGVYQTNITSKEYTPPIIITYSMEYKAVGIPEFKRAYQSAARNIFLQYDDKVIGYTFIHGDYSFNDEYMFTHILKINNKTHRLENLYTNITHGEDIKDFPSLEQDLNQVFTSEE